MCAAESFTHAKTTQPNTRNQPCRVSKIGHGAADHIWCWKVFRTDLKGVDFSELVWIFLSEFRDLYMIPICKYAHITYQSISDLLRKSCGRPFDSGSWHLAKPTFSQPSKQVSAAPRWENNAPPLPKTDVEVFRSKAPKVPPGFNG